jgi:hypothetical protein
MNPDWPEFGLKTFIIYVRPLGDDSTGNGSEQFPFRTLQNAARYVPAEIPAGHRYIIDVTGIIETLPTDYTLPPWEGAETISQLSGGLFLFGAAVAIQAMPRLVRGIPAAEAVINAPDIAATTPDPVTQLVTITLNAPRASWAANALRGKFAVTSTAGNSAVIWESDASFIRVTAASGILAAPIQIMEPSAAFVGSSSVNAGNPSPHGCLNAVNCNSIAFNGIKITTSTPGTGGRGLSVQGPGMCIAELCELQSPVFFCNSPAVARIAKNWIYGNQNQGTVVLSGPVAFLGSLLQVSANINFRQNDLMSISSCVLDQCSTIKFNTVFPGSDGYPSPSNLLVEKSLIRGSTGDGIFFSGGRGKVSNVDIYGCAGDGIKGASGHGFLELLNVRTTGAPNAGYGINITDGLHCRVNSATSGAPPGTQLRGTSGEMKVGDGAPRTWADFVAPGTRPALNEFDVRAPSPNGATGTGTRLYQ